MVDTSIALVEPEALDSIVSERNSTDLGERAAAGAAWQVAAALFGRIVATVVFVALSRLLAPSDFGVVALASVAVVILQAVAESGLGRALVRMPVLTTAHINTAFWAGTAWSALLAVILAATSVPLAAALGNHAAAPILAVMSLALLLGGLQSVQLGLLSRQLRFREISTREIAGSLAGCGAGIGAALAGAGAWALVAQLLVTQGFSVATLWVISEWRPQWQFDRSLLGELWRYGANFMMTSLAGTLQRNVDNLIVGAFLGVVTLGYYSVAYKVFLLVCSLTVDATATISLPTFSALSDQPVRLIEAYYRAIDLACRITFPVFTFLAIEGTNLIVLSSGARWHSAGRILIALCPAGALLAATTFDGAVLFARGQLRAVALLTVVTTVTVTVAFLVGVHFGAVGVAAGYGSGLLLMWPLRVYLVKQCSLLCVPHYARRIAVSGAVCAPMAGVLLLVRWQLAAATVVNLAVAVVAGVVAYVPMLLLFDRPMVDLMRNTARSAIGLRRAEA